MIRELAQSQDNQGRGLAIGFNWDRDAISLAAIAEAGNYDTLRVYEIGPNSGFLKIRPLLAEVPPGRQTWVSLIMESAYLDSGQYSVALHINHDAAGEPALIRIDFYITDTTGVDPDDQIPLTFGLEPAYPNPFNSGTRIGFTLDRPGNVKLSIYDLTGRKTAELIDEWMPTGRHSAILSGNDLSAGVYFYKLEVGDRTSVRRMVLLK